MEFEIMGIVGFAAITILCYVIAEIIKNTKLDNKWIPAICGVSGILLGVLSFYVVSEFPAKDILSASAIGAVSGFAATGVNQAYKQLRNNSVEYSDKGDTYDINEDSYDEQEE